MCSPVIRTKDMAMLTHVMEVSERVVDRSTVARMRALLNV